VRWITISEDCLATRFALPGEPIGKFSPICGGYPTVQQIFAEIFVEASFGNP